MVILLFDMNTIRTQNIIKMFSRKQMNQAFFPKVEKI